MGACDGWARHVGGCLGGRSPGEPPDEPAFLVDRDHERLAARARGLLQLGRDGCGGVAREPAVPEQHDATHLPVANPCQEPPVRRRRERPHHRLGGVGEAGDSVRLRRGAGPGNSRDHRNRRHSDETRELPQHGGQGSPGFCAHESGENAGPRAGTRLSCMAQAPALPTGFELPLEARLPRIGAVDAVALEERAASLAKRSIKRDAKVWALVLAIRTTDLTRLEDADTPGKAAAIASKALRPDPSDQSLPSCAAVCVYPNLVPAVRERVAGTSVKVAAVATGFPSGPYPTARKGADVRATVQLGADQDDIGVEPGAVLSR